LVEAPPDLGAVSADQPEVRQGATEANGHLRIVAERPVDGGAEVVVLGLQPTQPDALLGASEQRLRPLRQLEEELPLWLRQKVIAPVDGRPQGLVARQRPWAAGGEQAEAIIEAGGDLRGREDPHLGRRQLER
jgi:hypothetical protein